MTRFVGLGAVLDGHRRFGDREPARGRPHECFSFPYEMFYVANESLDTLYRPSGVPRRKEYETRQTRLRFWAESVGFGNRPDLRNRKTPFGAFAITAGRGAKFSLPTETPSRVVKAKCDFEKEPSKAKALCGSCSAALVTPSGRRGATGFLRVVFFVSICAVAWGRRGFGSAGFCWAGADLVVVVVVVVAFVDIGRRTRPLENLSDILAPNRSCVCVPPLGLASRSCASPSLHLLGVCRGRLSPRAAVLLRW